MNRELESLQNLHINGLLLTKLYNVWARKVQRNYVWLHSRLIQILKENWLVFSKIDKGNLANFHQSTWKSPNWNLDGKFLSKIENIWAYNLQGSYVSWQWRMMQKLKSNWLVSSKLTWRIWRICTLMVFFWRKYIMFGLEKVYGSFVW